MMCVCKHWHAIITGIWASIYLGTRTQLGAISRVLDRSPLLLDVVVDTDSDRADFTYVSRCLPTIRGNFANILDVSLEANY